MFNSREPETDSNTANNNIIDKLDTIFKAEIHVVADTQGRVTLSIEGNIVALDAATLTLIEKLAEINKLPMSRYVKRLGEIVAMRDNATDYETTSAKETLQSIINNLFG